MHVIFEIARDWLGHRHIPYEVVQQTGSALRLVIPVNYRDRVDQLPDFLFESTGDRVWHAKVQNGNELQLLLSLKEADTYLPDPRPQYQQKLAAMMDSEIKIASDTEPVSKSMFGKRLHEALDGIGAEHQPDDIIKRLNNAMRHLNIQDKLKDANITARISRDRQFITFIKETETESIRLLQMSVSQLSEPKDLEDALANLLDVAAGKAPGASKTKLDQLKDKASKISDIAGSHAPAAAAMKPQIPMQPVD